MCCVCLRTFHRWGGLVFIVDVLPVGWRLGFFPIGGDIFLISDLFMDIESAALFGIISFPYWWDPV